jgi:hypothetical protein
VGAELVRSEELEISVPRQHYPLGLITHFCQLVLVARTSMQAATRVLGLFFPADAQDGEIPNPTTGRWWLLRLGYYKLHCRKTLADDRVWLADHFVQIGKERCLAVAAVRLAHLPPVGQCLELKDLEPLAMLPVEASNGEIVHSQLEHLAAEVGVPRGILSDQGSDLVDGVKRFCVQHPTTARLSDMPHKAACLMKQRLEKDCRWAPFCTQVGQTKFQTGQTELAFLVPPKQRSKARYMNLPRLLTWARRTLQVVDQRPPQVLEHCSIERIEEKFGWVREYRDDVSRWSQLQTVAEAAVDLVRREGYSVSTAAQLPAQLSPLVVSEADAKLRDELVEFVSGQSQAAALGERLPGSTEVLESSFGKLKGLEGDHPSAGFTGMLLVWAALCGETTAEVIRKALTATPIKLVQQWITKHLGTTLQSKRRAANHAVDAARKKNQKTPKLTQG